MGFLKNVFGAAKKQRDMIAEEYRGIAGRVRWRERAAADMNASLDLATVPDLRVGARVPVRVDPEDWSKVLIAKTLS